MFEIRYLKEGEWYSIEYKPHTEMVYGAGLNDPGYCMGLGATFKVPEGAEEVYCFYHLSDGEEPDEGSVLKI